VFLIDGDRERFVYELALKHLRDNIEPHDVLLLVIIVRSPLAEFAVEDDRPFFLVGDCEYGVGTGREELGIKKDLSGDGKFCCFVGAKTPDLTEGNEFAEDFPSFFMRLAVYNL